jgi:hypothetical protein
VTKDGGSDEYRHIGSGAGLGLLGLYWHPWLVVGALLDVAVLAALVWPGWATR